jgi:hypothetical protein
MDAMVLLLLSGAGGPLIGEVCGNPLDEACGEFVELYNPGPEPVSVAGCSLTDGDALDQIVPWSAGVHGEFPSPGAVLETDTIPPEGFALILELGYLQDPCYEIPPGTVILTTGDYAICNGLAASSDPLTLFGPGGTSGADVLSTYGTPVETDNWQDRDDDGLDGIPFDPGDGLSVFRYPPEAPDAEEWWQPGEATPGGPPDTSAVFVQGVWFSPESPEPGQECTLYAAFYCWGTVPPEQGFLEVFLDMDGDSLRGAGEPGTSLPASTLTPGATDTLSAAFPGPPAGWYIASGSCAPSYLGVPMPSGGGIAPVITEMMANPPDQASQEYAEVYYPGPGVFHLAGCFFTDGDALDQVEPLSGTALLPAGCCGVILDPDYQGGLPVPPGARLFAPGDASLGNGLATSDPLVLYRRDGTTMEHILSTAGTPMLSDDPLMCDDDGLDGIPFNPGQGRSMERTDPAGPDSEDNWRASAPGGTPGWLESPWPSMDVRADSIVVPGEAWPGIPFTVEGWFSCAGTRPARGVTLTLFNDLDADGVPDPGETSAWEHVEEMAPGESRCLEGQVVLADHGFYLVRALCQCSGDTVPENDMKGAVVMCGEGAYPAVTEVLSNPSDQARDEFVELYHPGPGVFDPSMFTLSDGDSEDVLAGDFVPPGSWALVLDPDYFSGSMPYEIPPGTPVILPGNGTIGDGLSGNDPVILLRQGAPVSTYGTPDNPSDGIPRNPGTDLSMERISPEMPDLEENWFTNPLGPSPGTGPLGFGEGADYGAAGLTLNPPAGPAGIPVSVGAVLTCHGPLQGNLTVVFRAGGVEFAEVIPDPPSPGEPAAVEAFWTSGAPGVVVEAVTACPDDRNHRNDRASGVWCPEPGLVLNEIMYAPASPGPEWIELYNGAGAALDLSSFVFSDPGAAAELPGHLLEPGGFALICPDPQGFADAWGPVPCPVLEPLGWPALNNSGDTLTLAGDGSTDWVPYLPSWGGAGGASLERRSPEAWGFLKENWGGCLQGATPGAPNSVRPHETGRFLTASPRVFSPDGDGAGDVLAVTLELPEPGFTGEVKIFDVTGRVAATLWDGPIPGETLTVSWDGGGMPVGRYIVFARASSGSVLLEATLVRILAGRL